MLDVLFRSFYALQTRSKRLFVQGGMAAGEASMGSIKINRDRLAMPNGFCSFSFCSFPVRMGSEVEPRPSKRGWGNDELKSGAQLSRGLHSEGQGNRLRGQHKRRRRPLTIFAGLKTHSARGPCSVRGANRHRGLPSFYFSPFPKKSRSNVTRLTVMRTSPI